MTNMSIKVEHSEQSIQDLLCSAFEGGSNYWYRIDKYIYPEGKDKVSLNIEFPHLELPFKDGEIVISSDGDMPVTNLTKDKIEKGLQIFTDKYPEHYADWIAENDDATTGDVFLQCCLFGKLIFG